MLVHNQIPGIPKQLLSASDLAQMEQIDELITFKSLDDFTFRSQMQAILQQKQLLPLVSKVVAFVAQIRSAFFYEFELANFNVALVPPEEV